MIFGSHRTLYATQDALRRFPFIPVAVFKSSFLVSSILTYMLPKAMILPQSQPIPIHPLFLIGFSGVFASALNLLPLFRLDGGRACTAVLGPRLGALTSIWTLLLLLSYAMSGSGLSWAWGGLVLLFHRRTEIPARDEVTSVDDVRKGVWIVSILIAVITLAPFPGGPGMM
jgi:membrane-associated protease RseP (regulator of RpoE activity)